MEQTVEDDYESDEEKEGEKRVKDLITADRELDRVFLEKVESLNSYLVKSDELSRSISLLE